MGFYFRKRIGLGPLAVNLSTAGLGLSTGIRGLRAGINAHGKLYTAASVPGTGLYYRRYYKANHAGQPGAHATGYAIGAALPFIVLALIGVWILSVL